MKIGQQCADYTEAVARVDENIGFTQSGDNLPTVRAGYILECPYRGGSHGNNPPALTHCFVDPKGCLLRHIKALAMQFVFFHALNVDRLKSSQAHMQSDFDDVNVPFADLRQNFRCEV